MSYIRMAKNARYFCVFLIDRAMYLFVNGLRVLPVWNLKLRLYERQ